MFNQACPPPASIGQSKEFRGVPTTNFYITPIVRINGLLTEAPKGFTFDACYIPNASGAYNVPVTGFTYSVASGVTYVTFNPAGTLAAGTVNFPANARDGQLISLFTTQTITALTLSPASGDTIIGGVTTLAANGRVMYRYDRANTRWIRVG